MSLFVVFPDKNRAFQFDDEITEKDVKGCIRKLRLKDPIILTRGVDCLGNREILVSSNFPYSDDDLFIYERTDQSGEDCNFCPIPEKKVRVYFEHLPNMVMNTGTKVLKYSTVKTIHPNKCLIADMSGRILTERDFPVRQDIRVIPDDHFGA